MILSLRYAAAIGLALGALPSAVPGFAQTTPDASTQQAAAKLAENLCASCHGADGRGDNPRVPRIAGQQRAYIEVQLKAFRSQSRGDRAAHEYMWGVAATLDDNVVAALAQYFAAQAPAAGTPPQDATEAAAAAAGKQLFEKGSPERGVAPCAACHGANAEGMSVFPRLAGQHREYLFIQLQSIRNKLRDSPVMHGLTKELTDAEIVALATYLQSK
jgi:cytochrome c553